MKLENKIAVVTGGNSGIGRAIVDELVAEGAHVWVLGRDQGTLDAVAEAHGDKVRIVQGDVKSLADLDRLYEGVQAEHGRVDVLVANAGVAPGLPVPQVDEDHFDHVFDVNVKGLFFTVQKAIPLLSEGASVVLTGSTVIHRGMAGMSVYAATKGAVRSLARTFSAELVGRGIRVNVLSPGPITTPIFDRMGLDDESKAQMAESIRQQVPLGRFGESEEMAKAALFLASSDSSYVVGAELLADGGMSTI